MQKLPPPEGVLAKAEQEPPRHTKQQLLRIYKESIHQLRAKGWTYDGIILWLVDQGVPVKGMHKSDLSKFCKEEGID